MLIKNQDSEDRAKYENCLIKEYSKKLNKELEKGIVNYTWIYENVLPINWKRSYIVGPIDMELLLIT